MNATLLDQHVASTPWFGPSSRPLTRTLLGQALACLMALALIAPPPTVAQTLVEDIRSGTPNSSPADFTEYDGTLYFQAANGPSGQPDIELWATDLATGATARVKDIFPGAGSSRPGGFAVFNGKLYFQADDGTTGAELWVTDGTSTQLFADLKTVPIPFNSSVSSGPKDLTVFDGRLYFSALDDTHVRKLWVTDGTNAPSTIAGPSDPFLFAEAHGKLYFSAKAGTNVRKLWVTDGTAAGTRVVEDGDGTTFSFPGSLVAFEGGLYFSADDGTTGEELWMTDGTEAGTMLVKDIRAGSGSRPGELTVVGDKLYFVANNGTTGWELWVSDGTEAGTMLVKDVRPGAINSGTQRLTAFDGKLYFIANDGTTGLELWVSDGTEAGTMLVKDINAGTANSSPNYLTEYNGKLYFSADDDQDGREFWVSDGTEAGTILVADINSGSTGSNPGNLTEAGGKLYFRAFTAATGGEPWVYESAPVIACLDPFISDQRIVATATPPYLEIDLDAGAGATIASANFVDALGSTTRYLQGLTAARTDGGLTATTGDYLWAASGAPSQTATFRLTSDGSDTFGYFVEITNSCGNVAYVDPQGSFEAFATSMDADQELPARVSLEGNYPNPFNPQTVIRYGLPEAGTVRLAVYDAMGRQVRVLADQAQAAGWHDVTFAADGLPSGLYVYRLEVAGTAAQTGRMLLVK